MTYEEQKFRAWFKRWQKLFNFSEIEDLQDLPKRSIYKDLSGNQPLRKGEWSRLEKKLHALFFTIRGI